MNKIFPHNASKRFSKLFHTLLIISYDILFMASVILLLSWVVFCTRILNTWSFTDSYKKNTSAAKSGDPGPDLSAYTFQFRPKQHQLRGSEHLNLCTEEHHIVEIMNFLQSSPLQIG